MVHGEVVRVWVVQIADSNEEKTVNRGDVEGGDVDGVNIWGRRGEGESRVMHTVYAPLCMRYT